VSTARIDNSVLEMAELHTYNLKIGFTNSSDLHVKYKICSVFTTKKPIANKYHVYDQNEGILTPKVATQDKDRKKK
jgi:hypothetical protein